MAETTCQGFFTKAFQQMPSLWRVTIAVKE
jgi:hypothetical protein